MSEPTFTPRLPLDDQTLIALRALASAYFAKPRMGKLLKSCRSILADKFCDTGLDITVRDCSSPLDTANGTLTLGVFVNGVADQGLVFGKLKSDGTIYGTAANENAARA